MLHFLQPLFLIGISLIGIPLILHFFTRQRFTDIPFPSLMFLQKSRRRSFRTFTLHHLLILLCRILGIACLTLVFASPLVKGKLWGTGESRSSASIFLILDNTLSTRWHSRAVSTYDRIKEAAKEILNTASDKDKIYLSFPCGENRGETFSSAATSVDALISIVQKSNPDFCDANLRTTLKKAVNTLARASSPERKIIIITDAQRRALNFPPLPEPDFPVSIVLVDAAGGAKRNNLSLIPSPLPINPLEGETVPLCFELRGNTPRQNQAVSLTIGSEKRGERSVYFKPGGKATACFRLSFPNSGVQYGSINLNPDALEADNRWFFRLNVGKPQEVALAASTEDVENPASDAFFLVRAFRAAANAGAGFQSIHTNIISPPELERLPFQQYNIVILTSGTPVTLTGLKHLRDFAAQGGGILVFAGSQNNINKMISEILFSDKISIAAWQPTVDVGAHGRAPLQFIPMENIDFNHPIFSAMRADTSDMLAARFSGNTALKVNSNEIRVIASLMGNRPLFVENNIGQGRVLLMASSLNPYQTSFALQPFFVPWLLRACKYAGGKQDEPQRTFTYGEDLTVAFQKRIDAKTLHLRNLRSSKSYSLAPRSPANKEFIYIGASPLPPGVYAVEAERAQPPIDVITINADPDEGNLDRFTEKEWGKKFAAFPHRSIKVKGTLWRRNLTDTIFSREYISLLPIFLFAAVFALLLDTFFSNRR